jgi:hypothetical protein
MAEKKGEIAVRSSAAEYLTFVASTGESNESFEMRYEDENIWLTQKMMAALYDISVAAVNQHIKRIFDDEELNEETVIKKYLITASDGKKYNTIHYNLQMIIAVGFKVNNQRAVQFRKWAGQIVKDHKTFFQTVQNKLHFAVHRHTAAELIYERADADKEHMGLTTWENAPDGKIVKADVTIAKNYLSEEEMSYLERIVSLYLDYAELQAERKIPMSMEDWAKRLDGFLEFNRNELLTGPEKISAEEAKLHAETEYEKYRLIQDRLYESDFDRFMLASKDCK